jgi:LuxR family maltose regulon positive regulatory protein
LCDAVSAAGTDVTYGGNGSDARRRDVTSSGQAILEQLEHANMFIVPLDSDRCWYRYHHLFADLLRQRLIAGYPDDVPKLHSRASEWYADNGLVESAVEHALAARDIERAARLIEQAAATAFTRGRFATLHKWLEALPDDVLLARPLLCVFHVLLLLFAGHPLHEIEAHLKQVELADTSGFVAGQVTVLHAVLALFKGATEGSIELSKRALALLPEGDVVFRGLLARNLASVHKFTGDAKAAVQALDDVRRMSEKAGDRVGRIVALQLTAEMRAVQGRLQEARSLYEEALKLSVDSRGRRLPVAVKVLIGLGELLRQWNDLEAAADRLLQGIALAQQWSEAWGIGGYIILARVKQASGDEQGALEDVRTAERLAIEFDATDIDDLAVAAYQARLSVAQGNLAAAARWVEERGLESYGDEVGAETKRAAAAEPYYIREMEGTTLARVYLAQGRFREALVVLGPLLDEAGELGRFGTVIEILALQASAYQGEGRLGEAVRCLERALSLAEPEGYVRLFVDEGEPMARLLRDVASRGTAVDYVRRLLAAFDAPASETEDQAPTAERAQPLIEPLSERELEILQLFSEGLTNREVAQRLYISLHTVKWHAGNIYGKLAVTNRAKAVAKARALAILSAA